MYHVRHAMHTTNSNKAMTNIAGTATSTIFMPAVDFNPYQGRMTDFIKRHCVSERLGRDAPIHFCIGTIIITALFLIIGGLINGIDDGVQNYEVG